MSDILERYRVKNEVLSPPSSSQDETAQSVQEVLVDTLMQFFVERPANPSRLFHQLIQTRLGGSQTKEKEEDENGSVAFHNELMTLISPPEKPKKMVKQFDDDGNEIEVEEEEGEEEDEVDEEDLPKVGDILSESRLMEDAGIGISPQETYALALAMKGIAQTRKPKSIRFFGKFFGLNKNYYILELVETPKEEEEDEDDAQDDGDEEEGADNGKNEKSKDKEEFLFAPAEKHGTGANINTYLISNSAATLPEHWIQLPHSTPETIQTARYIKVFFTGDLDAKICSHPPFPGTERDYLRAQIARIWASTTVSPAEYMILESPEGDEDEEENASMEHSHYVRAPEEVPAIIQNEEYDPLKLLLNKLNNWVHITPTLLKSQGRCTLYRPEGEEDNEDEEVEDDVDVNNKKRKKQLEQEFVLPILTPISLEEPMVPTNGSNKSKSHIKALQSWVMNAITSENLEYVDHTLAVVRSTRWPGAYCIASINSEQKMKFVNVYIGFGHKAFIDGFSPKGPLDVQEENSIEDDEGNNVRDPEMQVEQVDATADKMKEFIEPEKPATPREGEEEDGEEEGEGNDSEDDDEEED